VSILDIYIFSVYIQYMNTTLTRIAVTVKNGEILPTKTSIAVGNLPVMTYKPAGQRFIARYGKCGNLKNQPFYEGGIILTVDGVEVATGAFSVVIKDAVEAWAKSQGAERVSVIIR